MMLKIFIFVIAVAIANASVQTGFSTYTDSTPVTVLTPTESAIKLTASASAIAETANPYTLLVTKMTNSLQLSAEQTNNANAITVQLHAQLTAASKPANQRLAAYLLATAYSDNNLQTKEEVLQTDAKKAQIQAAYRNQGFQGRGFVHFTGAFNYFRFSKFTGIDIATYPQNLLQANTAAKVFVYGALNGKFTGQKIERYIPAEGQFDLVAARRAINGDIRASDIAKLAQTLLA